MSKWIQNLRAVLDDKPVVLLHGNVRDRYIDHEGQVFENLTPLLCNVARQSTVTFTELLIYDPVGHERSISLNTALNDRNIARWSGEPRETLQQGARRQQEPPARTLARWARELSEPHPNRFAVLFYLDKLVSYKTSYAGDELECLLWLEKAIENVSSQNRLILVALQDSMLPTELYLQSPKCRLLAIPLPDKADRLRYLRHELRDSEHLELIADLSDGLYLREIDHIAQTVRECEATDSREIRRVVNRYRVGEQEDHWGTLSVAKIDRAFEWFTREEGIKGQDQAVDKVIEMLTLARSGLSGMASGATTKPKGTLFFAGPTGVGKTFLAKKLAKFLFNTEEAFIRLDMSEFKEEHTDSKLIGSPPGYVGYEQGGMLTRAVRERPFSVVLFDEIEKAHPRIMDIFLQMLDEGRLTDSRGQTVFFTETLIIFTSNIGCRTLDGRGNSILERHRLDTILGNTELSLPAKQQQIRDHFLRSVEEFFLLEISRPELLNRIGSNVVPFNYIHDSNTHREILASHLERIKKEFEDKYRQSGYRLAVNDDVLTYLIQEYGKQMSQFGGRGITNSLDNEIMRALGRAVLQAEYDATLRVQFRIELQGNGLKVTLESL
jgi:ATP-dependent Clp protease ATP-binding subunit ClpA